MCITVARVIGGEKKSNLQHVEFVVAKRGLVFPPIALGEFDGGNEARGSLLEWQPAFHSVFVGILVIRMPYRPIEGRFPPRLPRAGHHMSHPAWYTTPVDAEWYYQRGGLM